MKKLNPLLIVGLIVVFAAGAHAKAAFKSAIAMIDSAEAIAIVEIQKTEKVSVKGQHWTYAQKSTAKVEKTLKGQLPAVVSLYGEEDFICARCQFPVGRYLVFLDHDGELLTGNNWHLSTLRITGDQVEWLEEKTLAKKSVPLKSVLKEIEAVVAKAKTTKN